MLNLVTGKIGSGKSQVIKMLEERGFTCLKLDDYAKSLLREPEAYKAVISIFGSACLDCLGFIKPEYLRNAFMSEDEAMKKAYAEYEYYIATRCYEKISSLELSDEPIFLEFAWIKKFFYYCISNKICFNNVLLVTARDDVRQSRLLSRGVSQKMIDYANRVQDWKGFNGDSYTYIPTKSCERIDNSGSMSELFDNVQSALTKCNFSDIEKYEIFKKHFEKSPDFVKPNVYCYLYHNMLGCATCPFPCSNSDKHYEEAMKKRLEKNI